MVLSNGTYGKRIAKILKVINRNYMILDKGDYLPPRADETEEILVRNPDITHIVVVHYIYLVFKRLFPTFR